MSRSLSALRLLAALATSASAVDDPAALAQEALGANPNLEALLARVAGPMVGALVSSTLLTRIALPAIFLLSRGFDLRKNSASAVESRAESPDLATG